MNLKNVSDGALGFVAYDEDGAWLGCIHASSDGTIRQLEVRPDRRRKGIASALLRSLIAHCEPGTILTTTAACCWGGTHFYKAHGFVPVHRFAGSAAYRFRRVV